MSWRKNNLEQILKLDEKGKIAEAIVEDFLLSSGFEVYQTSDSHSHLSDGYSLSKKNLKKDFFYDVKSKQARNKLPDTGVDLNAYEGYIRFIKEKNSDFFIFFVDQELEKLYYFNLKNTIPDFGTDKYKYYYDDGVQYPKIETNKVNGEKYIYFALKQMTLIRNLLTEEVDILKKQTTDIGTHFKFQPFWDVNEVLPN